MKLIKRALMGLLFVCTSAMAYPDRPVKLIVPFPGGSQTDLVARMIAQQLTAQLGGTFVVENRPGAVGTIAATQVARAAPDGYTLLVTSAGVQAMNYALFKELSYKPADFAAIGLESKRVGMNAASDLRLIDEVAPNDDALWALRRLSCQPDTLCNRDAQQRIDATMANIDAGQRARQVGEAEAMLARYVPFIPLATPLRWSIASQRLTGMRANARAAHPLNHLIALPK